LLAAVGNINYNRARDHERTQAASTKALSMLKVETSNNLTKIQKMRAAFAKGEIEIDAFEDTAWKIVSEGGLPRPSGPSDVGPYRRGLLQDRFSKQPSLKAARTHNRSAVGTDSGCTNSSRAIETNWSTHGRS
jgi:hypothetical protein